MSAVAGILLLVIMGSRFIRYFSDAAEGDFPVTILGSLMVFHLPGFMELILPLSFFLGILLAYGQLYMNSEITVMVACGMSPTRLLRVTLLPASVVAVLVAVVGTVKVAVKAPVASGVAVATLVVLNVSVTCWLGM